MTKPTNDRDIESWYKEIVTLAPEYGNSGAEAWRDYFDEGMTPQQAITADRDYSYAA